ncbi:M15 family metallopeptidase [Microbacterium koreense]|uniref:M15 family metallopeptidase n=1 Tax=Microbacterium koreense TaxID=323761 RepID=A0ABW2ZNY2_9MICO
MAASGPPEIPATRRAARALREGSFAHPEVGEGSPVGADGGVRDGGLVGTERAETTPPPMTRRALREAREREVAERVEMMAWTCGVRPAAVVPPAGGPAILRPRAPEPLVSRAVSRPGVAPLLAGPAVRRTTARHARAHSRFGAGITAIAAVAGLFITGSAAAVTAAVAPDPVVVVAELPVEPEGVDEIRVDLSSVLPATPQPVAGSAGELAVDAVVDPCLDSDFTTALADGDESAAIAAAGGAAQFRDAVALGIAACVSLDDPDRSWVVINKDRPLEPIDHAPSGLVAPADTRSLDGGVLRADAAAALSAMAADARAAGAGDIAVGSAYRSYDTQVATYDYHVATKGQERADVVSARPGHSEHQSGLAVDVVPCSEVCGTIDDLAATPQGAWVAENAWRYGWIVRYEDGGTDVTGYLPEPWHLRYIGVELAAEYHDGGWHTLEEFFGLPPAPQHDH